MQGGLLQERNNGPYFLCQIYIGTTYFHNAFSELYNKLLEIYIHAYVGMDIMSMNHFTHKKTVQRKSPNYIASLYLSFSILAEDWLTGKKGHFAVSVFQFYLKGDLCIQWLVKSKITIKKQCYSINAWV